MIVGSGGIGKTQLAAEYIYRLCDEEATSQVSEITGVPHYALKIWLRGEQYLLEEDLRSLASWIGLAPNPKTPTKDIAQAVYERLSKLSTETRYPRVLLVFDNIQLSDGVESLLPQPSLRSNFHYLLTSRKRVWQKYFGQTYHLCELDIFSPEEAEAYFAKAFTLAVQKKSDYTKENRELLTATLAHFPMALAQATAYINQHSPQGRGLNEYLALIDERGLGLDPIQTVDNYEKAVITTWLISLPELLEDSQTAVKLLLACSYLSASQIPYEILFAYERGTTRENAQAENRVLQAIDCLVNYSLLEDNSGSFVTIHVLFQQVLRSWLNRNLENMVDRDKLKQYILGLNDTIEKARIIEANPDLPELFSKRILRSFSIKIIEYLHLLTGTFEHMDIRNCFNIHLEVLAEHIYEANFNCEVDNQLCINLLNEIRTNYNNADKQKIDYLLKIIEKKLMYLNKFYKNGSKEINLAALRKTRLEAIKEGKKISIALLNEEILTKAKEIFGEYSEEYAFALIKKARGCIINNNVGAQVIGDIGNAINLLTTLKKSFYRYSYDEGLVCAYQAQSEYYSKQANWQESEAFLWKALSIEQRKIINPTAVSEIVISGPQSLAIAIDIAEIFCQSGNSEKAINTYLLIEKFILTRHNLLFSLGKVYQFLSGCYMQIGQANLASEINTKAKNIFKDFSLFHYISSLSRLIISLQSENKEEETHQYIQDIAEAIQDKNFSVSSSSYLQLAVSLYHLPNQNIKRFVNNYFQRCQPHNPEDFMIIGNLYQQKLDFENSIVFYRKAILLEGENSGNDNGISIANLIGAISLENHYINFKEIEGLLQRRLRIYKNFKKNNLMYKTFTDIALFYYCYGGIKFNDEITVLVLSALEEALYIAYRRAERGYIYDYDYAITTNFYINTLINTLKNRQDELTEPFLFIAVYCREKLRKKILQANDSRPNVTDPFNAIDNDINCLLENFFKNQNKSNQFLRDVDSASLNHYCFYLCRIYLSNHIYDKAIIWFERCEIETINESFNPNSIYYLMARAYQNNNQPKRAIFFYKKTLENTNDSEEIFYVVCKELGNCCFQDGNCEKAIDYWRLVLKNRPDTPDIHHNLACYYHITNQYQLAEEAFKKGIELNASKGIVTEYAHYLVKRKNFRAALGILKQYTHLETDYFLCYGWIEYETVLPFIQDFINENSSNQVILSAQELSTILFEICYQQLGVEDEKSNTFDLKSKIRNEKKITNRNFKISKFFEIIDCGAGGNCLFHAVANQIPEETHESLRELACTALESNSTQLNAQLEIGGADVILINPEVIAEERIDNSEQYVELMKRPGTWGGEIELAALAQLFNRPITVIANGYCPLIYPSFIDSQGRPFYPGNPIFIYYNGHNHYQALRIRPEFTIEPRTILDTILYQSGIQELSNQMQNTFSSTEFQFFRKCFKESLIEHRHASKELQEEYDKRFGLVKK